MLDIYFLATINNAVVRLFVPISRKTIFSPPR